MIQKFIQVPFEGGYANLLFNFDGKDWTCTMPANTMNLLQSYINNGESQEIVMPYVDIGPKY